MRRVGCRLTSILTASLALAVFSSTAAADGEIFPAKKRVVIEIQAGSAQQIASATEEQRRGRASYAARGVVAAVDAHPDRLVTLKLRDAPVAFAHLPASVRKSLFDRAGEDAPELYESELSALLKDVLEQVRIARPHARISVLGLPVEQPWTDPKAARQANWRYREVIKQLNAFVASRWFLLAGGYLPEAVVVRMGLPETFRLRDSRPILYQRNGYWWILLSSPGPLAYEIEEGADRELLAKTPDDKRPDERTLLTDDPFSEPESPDDDAVVSKTGGPFPFYSGGSRASAGGGAGAGSASGGGGGGAGAGSASGGGGGGGSQDDCPDDPNKTDPGICGCGVPDTDSDGDLVPDCIDACPNDPNKVAPGQCGCGLPEDCGCLVSGDTWQNTPIAPQDGIFTVEYDATPADPDMDGLVALSLGEGSTHDDFAVLVRFNPAGVIQARNGDVYSADLQVPYTAGSSYHFRVVVNVPQHSYTVYVTPPDAGELVVATDYAFRTPQSAVAMLDNWGLKNGIGSGSHEVCSFEITASSPADCNDNGIPDWVDIVSGISEDCNNNGIPDECEDLSDTDGDGTPDCQDGCPNDPNKIDPGVCGCGVPDIDSDGDGVLDCDDGCPNDPAKTAPGFCGCGQPETDSDGDGWPDCVDGCPSDPNKIAPGVCGCGTPDSDSDGDGTPNCVDGCPSDPNKIDPGVCGCGTPDTDSDGDGTADCNDNCPDDPFKTEPGSCGCGLPDTPDCDEQYPEPTGWTEFTPSPDTRIVYVSSSEGSDSNSGLSQDQPVRTLAAGVSLMRNGFPDWLLLKRGDTWIERLSGPGSWPKGGRAVDEPMLISNYGQQSAPRPRIAHTGSGQALVLSTGSPPSFLAIVGIHFDGSNADSTADGFSARGAGSADILVENCLFDGGFDINIHLQDVARVSIRRCVIVDATRQGLFTSHVTDVLIEENLFDDNGTSITHDHNMYLSHGDSGFIIRNNITARSSNFGLKFRGPVVDSLIQDNIFAANHTMCQIHCKLESEENANIEFTGNIATQSGHTDKAGGLRINSTRHLLVSNNILANSAWDGSGAFKFYYNELFFPNGDWFQADDVVIQNNTVYAWRGHYVYFGDTPDDDAIVDLNAVVIANNLFQGLPEKDTGPRFLVAQLNPIELDRLDFFGNRYDSNEPANEWFRIDTAPYLSLSEWQVQADEPDGQAIDAQFVDPDRTLATYNQTLGGAPTLDAFLAEARLQSKSNWRPEYTAQSIAEYIRAGFMPQADVGNAGAVSPE